MREYRNVVIDFLKTFEEHDLAIIPRLQNAMANGLAFLASTYKLPHPNKQYTVEVKHHLTVPDNMRYWKVFGNEKQIERYLQSKYEFEDCSIDLESEIDSHTTVHSDLGQIPTNLNQIVVYEENFPVNKTIQKTEIHKDPEKEDFKVL